MKSIGISLILSCLLVFNCRKGESDTAEVNGSNAKQGKSGQELYTFNCMPCHKKNGKGVKGSFPPLAGSDFLKNKEASIRVVKFGLKGKIVVNAHKYNGEMPGLDLPDADIAKLMNYIFNEWGNSGGTVTTADVTAVKKDL